MDVQKILVMNGGGDAPGLNAVIRAAVKRAILGYDWEVVGSIEAFNGVLDDPMRIMKLDLHSVVGLLMRGGTILGTSNQGGPFEFPARRPDGEIEVVDRSDELIRRLHRIGVDAVVSIGGDGSQRIAQGLFEKGLPVVGVPKTIDNDLGATEMTFGFQTAVETATDAIDKLHTTAESHDRVIIVEVMGRDAGWIALSAGLAGGADTILIPEIPFEVDHIALHVKRRRKAGHHFAIIVVAEGAFPLGGTALTVKQREPGHPNPILGGVGRWLGDELEVRGFKHTRCCVLGHIQRGGIPVPMDRLLATRYGVAVVDLIAEGKFGHMVALRGDDIVSVPIRDAISHYRNVNLDHNLVRTARGLGVCLGDRVPAS
ncbi:MAG TPA: ATP-dependent 6-phosphofructokinase [Candidatus Binatia bacterium]|nr:ATP-dependent 6-phosphofructokinase [Candidatus Binatia bacterium]